MRFKMAAAAALAAIMLLTACSDGERETSSPKKDKPNKDKSSYSENLGTNNSESNTVEPVKKLGIWDVLPEIPVTDASAFKYEYDGELGGIAITDYIGESVKVRIPDTFEGEPVVKVDFTELDKSLLQLVMPDSVKWFCLPCISGTVMNAKDLSYNRTSLKYINFPKSCLIESGTVTLYSENSVVGCHNLVGVYIADGIATMPYFSDCQNLTNINIPDSVTKILQNAFGDCKSLTSVTIPDSVTEIGSYAFSDCTNLTSVTIPNSVTEIGSGVFKGCTSLTSVNIPNSVTVIDDWAFRGCTSLTSVNIPNSVITISNSAFGYCDNLKKVTYKGKTYDSKNIDALYKAINYGETGMHIVDGVLTDVSNDLTEVIIPNSVTKIGDGAFYGCTSLTSVTIPGSVTDIGKVSNNDSRLKGVFEDCTSLASVTISNGVTGIGSNAFRGCTLLTSVTIPDSVTYIGSGAFYGCTSLASVTISDGVTGIGSNAFSHCTGLASVIIPDSVRNIGDSAFSSCESLTSVTIPDSVVRLGLFAFAYCTSLTSATIGSGITKFGEEHIVSDPQYYGGYIYTRVGLPFEGCNSLTSITYKGKTYDSVIPVYNAADER